MVNDISRDDDVADVNLSIQRSSDACVNDSVHTKIIDQNLSADSRIDLADPGTDNHNRHPVQNALVKLHPGLLHNPADFHVLLQCLDLDFHRADDANLLHLLSPLPAFYFLLFLPACSFVFLPAPPCFLRASVLFSLQLCQRRLPAHPCYFLRASALFTLPAVLCFPHASALFSLSAALSVSCGPTCLLTRIPLYAQLSSVRFPSSRGRNRGSPPD